MENNSQQPNQNADSETTEQAQQTPLTRQLPGSQPQIAQDSSIASTQEQQPKAEPHEPPASVQLTAKQKNVNIQLAAELEKKQHSLVLIEAALYVAGRPLEINELCSVLNTRSKKKVQQLSQELSAAYAARNTAMEILQLKDERLVMQVKAEFTPIVKRLVNRPLLSSGPLKTLSYIAYRQPVTSKRVIEVRGQHAYGHIKLLREMDLVTTERSGRSIVLKTTDYFADYFGLTMDTTTLKRDLKRIFGEALKDEQQS